MALTSENQRILPGDGRIFSALHRPGLMHARPGSGSVVLEVGVYDGETLTWTEVQTWTENADVSVEVARGMFRVTLTGDAQYEFVV
ncbi:hypothetical protein [Roseovarius sp.]|uniref:hypothetical protein n=1 Tax=Roseovarius sp. TaxID=1486281 RepID=UPI003D10FD4C